MSLDRLLEHRRLWLDKPTLRLAYGVWFESLLETIGPASRVLEVGAGPGLLSKHAREHRKDLAWVASDLLQAPWNDLVADGLHLPFADGTLDVVAAVDLVHHLARPAAFFSEAARILRPRGHIVAIEPWVTPLSYPIYRFLHQEGCRLRLDPWNPFPAQEAKEAFEGDSGVVWRLVRDTSLEQWQRLGFRAPTLDRFNGFAYLATLGFRSGSLLPPSWAPWLAGLDRWTQPWAPLLALRVRVLWQKLPGSSEGLSTPDGERSPPLA